MSFQVGDLLRYQTRGAIPRVKHCVVLEAGSAAGIVYWFSGVEEEFKQHLPWTCIYGTFQRLS